MIKWFEFAMIHWYAVGMLALLLAGFFYWERRYFAPKISVQDLVRWMNDIENSLAIIDIRSANLFKAGAIKHSINYSNQTTVNWPIMLANHRNDKLVFICERGNLAQAVANKMKDAGFDAYNLEGGMLAWQDAGFPLS